MNPKNSQSDLEKFIPDLPEKPHKWKRWKEILDETDRLINHSNRKNILLSTEDDVIAMLKRFGIHKWDEDLLGAIAVELYIEITVTDESTTNNLMNLRQNLVKMLGKNRQIFDYVFKLYASLWGDMIGASKETDALVPKEYFE
jgi:hypothetical protein